MGRARGSRAALLAALATGLALAGCSGDRDTGEGRRIEAAVKRFALARGPEACNLMTHHGLTRVYGGASDDPVVAKRRCRAQSGRFQAEAVDVTFVRLKSGGEAQATAKAAGGRRWYTVALVKRRDRWLIEAVTTTQAPA
jgi:hypothetical protein